MDAMLDIETLGVDPGAAILSAGVVYFNPSTGKTHDEELFLFDPRQQPERSIEYGTMIWWMNQTREAQAHWRDSQFPNLQTEIARFVKFCKKHGDVTWWACGPHFDFVMMESLLKQQGTPAPWKFWKLRDTRTLRDLIDVSRLPANANAHNPIADCKRQISEVAEFHSQGGGEWMPR
jgi:exodeoxyribonuclease VIII